MTRQSHSVSISLLALLVLSAIGCAGLQPTERSLLLSGMPYPVPAPGAVLGSVEEAAIAALVHARTTATRVERESMLVGSIVRVENGLTWSEPQRSGSFFRSAGRPVVRYVLSGTAVATYVVHPRTGHFEVDRLNERITPSEKRFVKADPRHRPVFLLTPSGRVLSYAHDAEPVEVAAVRWGRADRGLSISRVAEISH
ncbi:MAG: hypothetical protein CL908_14910 [Deltaproteobacteria bacterium]|jgi:hypothetical protein|nr:hypothetical protein [Deltaproteobacteria bacterium]